MAMVYQDSLFTIHHGSSVKVQVAMDFRDSFKAEIDKAVKLLMTYDSLSEHD